MRPVSFDHTMLRPLPQELLGATCGQCDKPQAVWALVHATQTGDETPFVCSLCMLYKSRWSTDARESIDALIAEVEWVRQPFERSSLTGELVSCRDADRIMFAVVAENYMTAAKERMAR